ncbi:MAG: M23 family metallopeptidase [Alsobacter sp.]
MTFRPLVTLLACAAATLSAPALAEAPAAKPIFTTLAVSPIFPPRPFKGADGLTHLAYELSIVNMTSLVVEVDTLSVLDAASGEELASWSGDRFKAMFRLNGRDPASNFAPAESGLFFVDVGLPAGKAPPRALAHRLSTTRKMKAPGTDPHKGRPLEPAIAIPEKITFTTSAMPVDRRPAIRLAAPLRGAGWVVGNGCCDSVTSHRGAAMAFNGKVEVPERFAIDFVQIGSNGAFFEGPEDKLESYRYYGVPVHAAAPGKVVGIVDDMPEGVPGKTPAGVTTDNAAGNHVVVDMGKGNYALYAHLKTGSVTVKPGQRVATGQVLGLLGNTGNSDAPHLHFHVMNGPSPLGSQGLPYVFDRFAGQGRADLDDEGAMHGKPVKVDPSWNAGPKADALPLNNEVVDFGQ